MPATTEWKGMQRWVRLGAIANNLIQMGKQLAHKPAQEISLRRANRSLVPEAEPTSKNVFCTENLADSTPETHLAPCHGWV